MEELMSTDRLPNKAFNQLYQAWAEGGYGMILSGPFKPPSPLRETFRLMQIQLTYDKRDRECTSRTETSWSSFRRRGSRLPSDLFASDGTIHLVGFINGRRRFRTATTPDHAAQSRGSSINANYDGTFILFASSRSFCRAHDCRKRVSRKDGWQAGMGNTEGDGSGGYR